MNHAPAASAGPDVTIDEGDTVVRLGSYTDPDVGDTQTFLWEVRDSGDTLVFTTTDQTLMFPTDDNVGQPFTAMFTVTDSVGSFDTDSFVINVNNVSPTAVRYPSS